MRWSDGISCHRLTALYSHFFGTVALQAHRARGAAASKNSPRCPTQHGGSAGVGRPQRRETNHEASFANHESPMVTSAQSAVSQTRNRGASNHRLAVRRFGSGRLGVGNKYRAGRARFCANSLRPEGSKSMVPRAALAVQRRHHRLGHERLPHLVVGRLRVPGQ